MKTSELKRRKIAEVWIIHHDHDSCFENATIIKENYEEARKCYEHRCKSMEVYADKYGFEMIKETNCCYVLDKKNDKFVQYLSMHQQKLELIEKI